MYIFLNISVKLQWPVRIETNLFKHYLTPVEQCYGKEPPASVGVLGLS